MRIAAVVLTVLIAGCSLDSLTRYIPDDREDAGIAQSLRTRLDESFPSQAPDIGVVVEDGVAYVEGHVGSESVRTAVGETASRVPGVKRVVNNLHVM